ncbi:hypothetical protein Mal4_10130 [Maioricimonas rarisocia]|uniref:Uncharacterized protein n=1 Tax=Maioricimonas rarisocia TaxID=2528026 RepID=A0A517Z2M3_9PLAN|nr:hypothetical protein [Maioricimonas rarisocia]QDU36718.1 hypothetical protein Mal4_10130 [Maioricimonas rarisocia]
MLAQVGFDQLVGPILAPYLALWYLAAGVLLGEVAIGIALLCIRLWNRDVESPILREDRLR